MDTVGRPAAHLCSPLLQAGSTLKVVVRTAVPLTDMLSSRLCRAHMPGLSSAWRMRTLRYCAAFQYIQARVCVSSSQQIDFIGLPA